MNKKSLILSITAGLALANGVFASDPKTEKDERQVINSIDYIDEDADFELGFDTADYLPEGFDPYKMYIDLGSVIFMEEEVVDGFVSKDYLPKGFDAYAYPMEVEAMNYIDENDNVELDLDTAVNLPEGFDAYSKK